MASVHEAHADVEDHRILKLLGPADYVTLTGALFGLGSIFASLSHYLEVAAALILLGVLCDFLDGRVARMTGRPGPLGAALDNLADVVIHLVAVVLFAYAAGLTGPWALAAYGLFLVAGVLRLARYELVGTIDGYYEGVPTPASCVIPLIYLACGYAGWQTGWIPVLYLALAVLMVSTLRIKKW